MGARRHDVYLGLHFPALVGSANRPQVAGESRDSLAPSAAGVGRTVANGNEDLGLGIKFALTGQAGLLPEMALVPQMRVPTGSADLSAHRILPGLNWIYGWDVTERLSAGGQTQLNQKLDDVTNGPYVEFSQSFTMGFDWTDRFGSYAEWFVLSPDGDDSNHTQNYFDGGMTILVTDNVQLDVRAGVGLNDAADDFFTGVGLSVQRLSAVRIMRASPQFSRTRVALNDRSDLRAPQAVLASCGMRKSSLLTEQS